MLFPATLRGLRGSHLSHTMPFDTKRYPILYVDDEPQVLATFRYAIEDRFTLLTASSAEDGLAMLGREEVAVLVADQQMPRMGGAELCARARELKPDLVCMIMTAYADRETAIEAINRGRVSAYLTKPWNEPELIAALTSAIERGHTRGEARRLGVGLLREGPRHVAATVRAEVAHEVQNPLQALRAHQERAIELVEATLGGLRPAAGDDARDQLREALEHQRDALAALGVVTGVTKRYLGDARPATEEPETCDVAGVVQSATRLLRDQIALVAQLRIDARCAPVACIERIALGQVVVNLLLNSAQAMVRRPGGVVTVVIDEEGADAVVRVEDTGPGIAAEHLDLLFDPYFTTREAGAGLGLAIVRDIVEEAGGEVSVRSEPGRGATFEVRVPRVTDDGQGAQ